MAATPIKNIVLVHGAWGDGSHWRYVIPALVNKGFTVTAVQNPLESFDGDIAKTETVLAAQDGPTLLVGHSYGGAVITAAGRHDKVAGLVYVAAYAPDTGESALELTAKGGPLPDGLFVPDAQGFLLLNRGMFAGAFCQDAKADDAAVLNAAQKPTHPACLQGKLAGEPAWKTKPSWYALSSEDHTVVPDLQTFMSGRMKAKVTAVKAGHASMVTKPDEITALILAAAKG